MSKRVRVALSLLSAVALIATTALTVVAAPTGQANGLQRVIVVLHDQVADPGAVADEVARRHGGRAGFVYQTALRGFSAELPPAAIAAVGRDARVAFVEVDQPVFAFQGKKKPTPTPAPAPEQPVQTLPTGITRSGADQSSTPAGSVGVAILDTGIASHPDLNIAGGVSCLSNPVRASCKAGGYEDGNGHGTHVAGTVAAKHNEIGVVGVAPGAPLWAVKVLDDNGSGYISGIIAGIDWVTANAASNGIRVANMSLGCECTSAAMDAALDRSVDGGVTYVAAAGNSAKDAATFSPANHPKVISVAALADFDGAPGGGAPTTCREDVDDTFADFSNFGSSVDIVAPGVCILSTWHDGGYHTISGTSMASPHVAGAAALWIAGHADATPAAVKAAIQASAREDVADVPAGTFSGSLFAGAGSGF